MTSMFSWRGVSSMKDSQEKPDWRTIAVDLYEMVLCATEFDPPPKCYGYTQFAMAARLRSIVTVMRKQKLDKNFEEAVAEFGIPVCDKCHTFDCVIGVDMCPGAATAGFIRIPV